MFEILIQKNWTGNFICYDPLLLHCTDKFLQTLSLFDAQICERLWARWFMIFVTGN